MLLIIAESRLADGDEVGAVLALNAVRSPDRLKLYVVAAQHLTTKDFVLYVRQAGAARSAVGHVAQLARARSAVGRVAKSAIRPLNRSVPRCSRRSADSSG